ncbi:MAG: hypothetical protein ACLFQK_00170 [Fibrobacterota bacterium]
MIKYFLFFKYFFLILFLFSGCSNIPTDGDTASGGSETENNTASGGSETENNNAFTGQIFYSSGIPAPNAEVSFIPYKNIPLSGSSSIKVFYTDSSGKFYADTIADGIYNVFSSDGNGQVSFDDSINYSGLSEGFSDTLAESGAVSGNVKLAEGDPLSTVIIFGLGNEIFEGVDADDGSFSISGLAEGEYSVRIISTLDKYLPKDTVFEVSSGTNNVLSSPIVLSFRIPPPENSGIFYDSMKRIAEISWGVFDTSIVSGINIYREKNGNGESLLLNSVPVTETFFIDSSLEQGQTYSYSLVSVSYSGEEGPSGTAMTVKSESCREIINVMGNGAGSSAGCFNGLSAAVLDKNGNIFCADRGNSRVQKLSFSGEFLSEIKDPELIFKPADVALDSGGRVFILEQANNKIYMYDENEVFSTVWGTASQPALRSISINGDRVVTVSDDFIHIFDLSGTEISSLSTETYMTDAVIFSDSILFVVAAENKILKKNLFSGISEVIFFAGLQEDGISNDQIGSLNIMDETLAFLNYSDKEFIEISFDGGLVSRFSFYEDAPELTPVDLEIKDGLFYIFCNEGRILVY